MTGVRAVVRVACCIVLVSLPATALAFEARVTRVRLTGARLWAVIEVRDLLRDRFLELLREGKSVFVQMQADLWEDRRVFDRVVLTSPAATYRLDQDSTGVIVLDQYGGSTRHADVRQPVPLRVELGAGENLDDTQTYYLHAVITAATVDQREIDQAGEALFGEQESAGGLAALGRFVFRTLLRVGKYFETAEAEVTSRRVSGREIRAGAF